MRVYSQIPRTAPNKDIERPERKKVPETPKIRRISLLVILCRLASLPNGVNPGLEYSSSLYLIIIIIHRLILLVPVLKF